MEKDYHTEIGWPDVDMPTGKIRLNATRHARRESNSDRYGGFSLPDSVTVTEEMYQNDDTKPHIFEITVDGGRVVKFGLRRKYDENRDIILIIRPWENIIVTAWINMKDDPHATLDESKYTTP